MKKKHSIIWRVIYFSNLNLKKKIFRLVSKLAYLFISLADDIFPRKTNETNKQINETMIYVQKKQAAKIINAPSLHHFILNVLMLCFIELDWFST